jgi:signal transduction histidine kinase
LIVICAWAPLVLSATSHAAEHKRIMILHSVGREFRPWTEYAKFIRAALDEQSPWPLDVQEHSLVAARSNDANPDPPFVAYLQSVYGNGPPDLILGVGAPATAFIQRYRSVLFPATPALFTAIEQRRVDYSRLTENEAVVAVRHDFRVLFESFLQISPNTKIVAVVVGSSPNERFWRNEMERELTSLEKRIEIRWYDGISFEDILKQTAVLPPHSAIFWNQMAVDGAGVAHEGDRALIRLYAVANAPIFTHDDAFFGREIIGGPMHSALAGGQRAAAVAIRILGGEKAGNIKTEPADFAAPKYDWNELRRWGISESRLPPGSKVYFREPTMWENYRWQIAMICAVIVLQGALISGLLFEHRRRQLAEVQARQRMADLAHINRHSTAGELTASIAHELNQPLGAILTNSETAEALLKSSTPNLNEIAEILADIRRDDQRASDVIRRFRSLLKKAPFELKNIDLNEIVHETIRFLSALAIARQVNIVSSIAPSSLPIKGDQIQLQQVILNLFVNAMDAMSDMSNAERRITVSTARDGNSADLSVSDVGPGIPPEKLKEVFGPFFTTKPQGMGLGLSIARTIIEAHGGQLSAQNQAGRGATFRIRLPLAALPN